jgi:hypothetical protein
MEILKFFEHKIDNYIILTLKDEDWDDFVNTIIPEYKSSYISDDELQLRITELHSDKATEFSEILPDKGSIKSGDFGEILSYLLFKNRHKKRQVDGPKKWRWKQEKNVAAPYTDVILYSMKHKKPSKDDLLISVESKMKAVANNGYHPIQNAIDGAEKDYVSRIANSLSWIRKKYKDELVKANANKAAITNVISIINRYIQSETTGPYSKKVKAIAIIDKDLLEDELVKTVTVPSIPGLDLAVFVVSIKDLQGAYETVFQKIPTL